MGGVERFIYMIDEILDTKRKRRIVGGLLLRASLFFGGLAFTVITIKDERRLLDEG